MGAYAGAGVTGAAAGAAAGVAAGAAAGAAGAAVCSPQCPSLSFVPFQLHVALCYPSVLALCHQPRRVEHVVPQSVREQMGCSLCAVISEAQLELFAWLACGSSGYVHVLTCKHGPLAGWGGGWGWHHGWWGK